VHLPIVGYSKICVCIFPGVRFRRPPQFCCVHSDFPGVVLIPARLKADIESRVSAVIIAPQAISCYLESTKEMRELSLRFIESSGVSRCSSRLKSCEEMRLASNCSDADQASWWQPLYDFVQQSWRERRLASLAARSVFAFYAFPSADAGAVALGV